MKTLKKFSLVLFATSSLFAHSTFAFGGRSPEDARPTTNPYAAFEQASLIRLAGKAGVDSTTLKNFYSSLQDSSASQKRSTEQIQRCTSNLRNTFESRASLLDCLGSMGRSSLNESLFVELEKFSANNYALQHSKSAEQSLFLAGLIQDLVRQNRLDQGLPASWFDLEEGFLDIEDQTLYSYEHGDVVLGMGNTSISALISQTTSPQSRFSHTFLMSKTDQGDFHTLEALVETGVKEHPAEHFVKDPYNELWVTRWKNTSTRSRVTKQSVAWAQKKADDKTHYDLKMDGSDDSKIFCSELVVSALKAGSGLPMSEIVPSPSKISSDAVFKFLNRVGVEKREIPSPSDLLESKHLQLKAKYRKTSDLTREWELFLFGDLFTERLDRGANFDADPAFFAVPGPIFLLQLFPSLLIDEARVIPKGIGPGTLAVMATTELKLFRPVLKHAREDLKDKLNLIDTAPWVLRGRYSAWMENSHAGRRHFKIKD